MNHAVRIKGVTVACLPPIEIQTHLTGMLRQRLLARNRLLQRHLIFAGNQLRQRTCRVLRSRRGQLKTMPHHLNLVTVLKLGERLLQVTFAHVAEGAHNIRPNINTHSIYSSHTRMGQLPQLYDHLTPRLPRLFSPGTAKPPRTGP